MIVQDSPSITQPNIEKDDVQINRLQETYVNYLKQELPDQLRANYVWDEAYELIAKTLYPHNQVIIRPALVERGIIHEPIIVQQIFIYPVTKGRLIEYLKEKTGDDFIATTSLCRNMPEIMKLEQIINLLGSLGEEINDFAHTVLGQNSQNRFSMNPYVLSLLLVAEQRKYFADMVEEDIKNGNISILKSRQYFSKSTLGQKTRIVDKFEIFKVELKKAFPSINAINAVLRRYGQSQGGFEMVIQCLKYISDTYVKPWTELIMKREEKFKKKVEAGTARERRKNWNTADFIKADELNEYIKRLKDS
ncbi:MAG: hypothetical protein HRF42_12975 [Candidatus Brocadia sp.]|jgi:hypothetical protein